MIKAMKTPKVLQEHMESVTLTHFDWISLYLMLREVQEKHAEFLGCSEEYLKEAKELDTAMVDKVDYSTMRNEDAHCNKAAVQNIIDNLGIMCRKFVEN